MSECRDQDRLLVEETVGNVDRNLDRNKRPNPVYRYDTRVGDTEVPSTQVSTCVIVGVVPRTSVRT